MADPPVRIFTVEQANALLPRIRLRVAELLRKQRELQRIVDEALGGSVGLDDRAFIPSPDDDAATAGAKREVAALVAAVRAGWDEIASLGVVVKDPRVGLIDFYARIDGRAVLLCWRYEEATIGWYHDVDAGFAGRKPLRGAIARRSLN